jgi:hypothetical protein
VPFHLHLQTDFADRTPLEIFLDDEIKLSTTYSEVIVRFDQANPFQTKKITCALRHPSSQIPSAPSGTRKDIIII